MRKVLSTKKLEPWLVQKAKDSGIDVQEQPAIQIQPIVTSEKSEEIYALLQKEIMHAAFTSSNAVSALKKNLANGSKHLPLKWKMFCLSGKTKEEIEKDIELWGSIEATAKHSKELAETIIEKEVREVIFFCGNKRREELPQILSEARVTVHEVVLYETIETPTVAENDFDAVLFFSPSAVQSFFSVNQLKKEIVCFAVGETTAQCIKTCTNNKVITSTDASQEAVLKEVQHYFTSKVSHPH